MAQYVLSQTKVGVGVGVEVSVAVGVGVIPGTAAHISASSCGLIVNRSLKSEALKTQLGLDAILFCKKL